MADILLNKIINEEISSSLLIKWILKAASEEEDFNSILACNVSQIDFITYFLNFIHEEISCSTKFSETPQKLGTPKRIEEKTIDRAKQASKVFKNSLFRSEPLKVQDEHSSLNYSLNKLPEKITTPIATKTTPLNKSGQYFSPISPLYHNANQNNFDSKETNDGNRKSADKHSLCLGDFLVTTAKSSSKKKKQNVEQNDSKRETSRRINPTSVHVKQSDNGFQRTENSFNFQDNTEEVPVKTAVEQRNVLVEERMKILSRKDGIEPSKPAVLKRHNSLSKSDVTAMSSLVTFKTKIELIVDIYKTILDRKFVLNITSEVYYLISLSLTRQVDSRTLAFTEDEQLGVALLDDALHLKDCGENVATAHLSNMDIFGTIHNVVYFAVKCLESQFKVIRFYDKTTLRLLADNSRIRDFSPVLSRKLQAYAEKKTEKQCIEIDAPVSLTNVCFNIDTDNKDNFIDLPSFHAFRKQRDLFYEILRIWEVHHLAADWDFALGLGGKIRSLFSFHGDPTNYMHFARLFKNQLLSSCARGSKVRYCIFKEKGLSENNLSFLPSIPIDAEKLSRLTNRLVTKQASNGINSLPQFSGYQEFFRDFIVVASSCYFNKHLCDTLIAEIVELNDTKFSGLELEDEGNEVDHNTRKLYVRCIKTLRMLAKFLGFVESLPYRSDAPNVSKNVSEAQIKIRQQCVPLLNVKSLLKSAIDSRTVVFLIPWLTKYLAMLDYVTLRLDYYKSVHVILFDLYRNYNISDASDNAAAITFCLGWLFELPHFPELEYFNFCSKAYDGSNHCENSIKVNLKAPFLDDTTIVNQSVLYLCCPYLEEIKKIVSTNAPGNKGPVKYITPVTALETNGEIGRKKLEQQLEEAFFGSQPTSLRKTIEFVSERIASTAVKFICHDLVPKAKKAAVKELRDDVLKNDDPAKYIDDHQRKSLLKALAVPLAQSHLKRLQQACDEQARKILQQKIPPCIDGLLPLDTLEATKHVCARITEKMYSDRVKQWVNSHVNLSVFAKDFDSEIQKKVAHGRRGDKEKSVFILPGGGRDRDHNEATLSGFHALNDIREACCKAIENDCLTTDYVLKVLEQTYASLTQRNDVNNMITGTISLTIFDLCLVLVAKYPGLFSEPNDDLTSHFLKIWSHQPKSNSMFKTLFCPRIVKMFEHSTKKDEAWTAYAQIVSCLLNEKLVEEEDLESQCTGFYNRDWAEDTLERFSHFLGQLVKCKNCDTADNKFAYLLGFLSDFCSDL